MSTPGSVENIVRAVSRYLRANPLASDTLRGIQQWWLPSITVTPDGLEQAFERLQKAGVVDASLAADGQVHYRRAGPGLAVDAQLDRFIAGDMT
jgi:hypothetical protein